jgi:hypothetical protein
MNKPEIKNWVLTPHAAQRISERSISINEVQEVLRNPDMVKEQGAKLILAKKLINRFDNMIACVVLEQKENDLWIVIQ